EYWSANQRANVEAARAAGVHLAFFSGNQTFWKTRYENSIDGSNTAYRTLVSYKETHANATIAPADPPTSTDTWRDPRFSQHAARRRSRRECAGRRHLHSERHRLQGAASAIPEQPHALLAQHHRSQPCIRPDCHHYRRL